jgi:serine/alanine adding enzyme
MRHVCQIFYTAREMTSRPYKLFGSSACRICVAGDADGARWDRFVHARPDACLYHEFAWRDVIHGTYGHRAHYLMATGGEDERVVGVLPLFHLRSRMFGSSLVSLPFADSGGILAEDADVAEHLLSAAVALARQVHAKVIDLRSERPCAACEASAGAGGRGERVRMLLALPGSSVELARSYRSKLRNQINRPLKEGCSCALGGLELLEDFYKVFLINMRDLGSPVHSKELMRRVLESFPERSRIFVVRHRGRPVAASLVVGFNRTLSNPWASSDRRYAAISPNMLLYSRMLEFACDEGYRTFDFGRSAPGEGTFRFKQQWGALAEPLYWYGVSAGDTPSAPPASAAQRFGLAARVWSKMPIAVTRILGPRIRGQISL